MAAFGLSEGSSWGSEASRPRCKRPYRSPSPLEEDWEDEEGGWGGPWGSRDERERPRRPREAEVEAEGGRSRPRWDPPRGGSGRSRSPPSSSRSGRARRSLERSGESPGPPSSASAWRSPEPRRPRAGQPSSGDSSCFPSREGGRGQRMMDSSRSQRSSNFRSERGSTWESRQDPDHRGRETYLKNRDSGERHRGLEAMEGGFPSYASGARGRRSPSPGEDEGGSSWGSPKWKEDRKDSPSYRVQGHFDSNLRGSKRDSPELRRRDYERPSTSAKGLEVHHSTSEDLEDWGSSTNYLEERSLEEDQADRKNLQGDLGGPKGRPKIYVGSDKRAVASRMWVPRGEVVDFWNECQSVMQSIVKKHFLSTCPRPTLPGYSCETPALNSSIRALLNREQLKYYMISSHFLRLTHEELLNMLGPVMTLYEMAEESIEKCEGMDPLELREWARRMVRYVGSLNQRLKLERSSQVLEMINPGLKKMATNLSGQSADGLLFAKNKEKDLKDLIQNFPELESQTRVMKVRNDGDQKLRSKKFPSRTHNRPAELNEEISAPQSFAAAGAQGEKGVSLELWHRRFGHQDEKTILELQNRSLGVGIWINNADARRTTPCAVCLRVKGPNPPSLPRIERRSRQVLDLIHGHLHGPLPEPSLRNFQYALIFVDDFSRYCVSYLLRDKENIQEMFLKYMKVLDRLFQRKPKAFQMETGAESLLHASEAFLEKRGILFSAQGQQQHAPEDSGTSRREMRSLLEMTRCMLADAALPSKFWADAFMMATHVLNRLPVEGSSQTPFALWHGRTPNVSRLRVFGSLAYARYTAPRNEGLEASLYSFQEEKKKQISSAEKTLFLGYIPRCDRYRVMIIETGQVDIRSVYYFVEEKAGNKKGTLLDPSGAHDRVVDPLQGAAVLTSPQPVSEQMQEQGGPEGEPSSLGKGDRGGDDGPDLLEEAQRTRDAPETAVGWSSCPDNRASPPHLNYPANPLLGMELGTCEGGGGDSAGLVDKGFIPNCGEDFDQTFAPALQRSTLRMLLSISTSKQMQVKHLKVSIVSQHRETAKESCMGQAAGFLSQDHFAGALKKGLPGWKRAARAWSKKLKEVLSEEGFRQDCADPCLYNRSRNGHLSFVLSHMDELVVATQREQEYAEITRRLSDELEIKELGDATQYLDNQMKKEGDGSCSC